MGTCVTGTYNLTHLWCVRLYVPVTHVLGFLYQVLGQEKRPGVFEAFNHDVSDSEFCFCA